MHVLTSGSGGMIGGHLVKRLLEDGHTVRAVDVKPLDQWWQVHPDAENVAGRFGDLRDPHACRAAVYGMDRVYHLAADMGGIGHISKHRADCAYNTLITLNLLEAAADAELERFFFSSSACVYSEVHQLDADVVPLREEHAYPAMAEPGYGWSKLYDELLCEYVRTDWLLETRVARYHNVYGTFCSWDGGREKAPAALCRKVAEAVITGDRHISIWGDGEQTRSFMAMDDCVEGTLRIAEGDYRHPLNLGSSELVTVNQLVDLIESIAGVTLERSYDRSAPQGVRGRNSDNTLIQEVLGWQPSRSLRDGLEELYPWIYNQVEAAIPRQRALTI